MGLSGEDGQYHWVESGEELQDSGWWKDGEPDSSGECVITGGEGLQDEVCDGDQAAAAGPLVRSPLCMQGNNSVMVGEQCSQ